MKEVDHPISGILAYIWGIYKAHHKFLERWVNGYQGSLWEGSRAMLKKRAE